MTAEIYALNRDVSAGYQGFSFEMSRHMQEHWGKFQEQVRSLPSEVFESIQAQVLAYESTYREAFRALGERFAVIAETYPQDSRFSMSCLPRHLEGLGPDRHYERGC